MKRQTKRSLSALAFAAAVGFSGAAGAALIDRGGGLIYDDVLNITWLQNANLLKTQYDADNDVVNQIIAAVPAITHTGTVFFPSPYSITASDFDTTTGGMTWFGAMAWAEWLNFGGYGDWRLASMSVSGGVPTGSASSVVNCSTLANESACPDNELGYMYHYNLTPSGDTPPTDLGTNLTGNQGPFTNIQSGYWSGTEYAPVPVVAWVFDAFGGSQFNGIKGLQVYAWAVRPGDVGAAVPEPASIALVGLGLVGLGWARRRRG